MKKEEPKVDTKKKQTKLYQEAGLLILLGSLIIVILSIAVLLLNLFDMTGKDYVTNVTIVIPFIAISVTFLAWKMYFFPKPVEEPKKKRKK